MQLETDRLTATPLEESDLELLEQMDSNPQVMKTLGGLRTAAQTAAYLQENLEHWDRHGYGLWMLRSRSDNAFVGRAVLRHVHVADNDEIEVGYALMPEFWGRGLATEVGREIVRAAFEDAGLSDLVAFTLPTNQASQNVIRKLGGVFEKETTYKGFPHVLFRIKRD